MFSPSLRRRGLEGRVTVENARFAALISSLVLDYAFGNRRKKKDYVIVFNRVSLESVRILVKDEISSCAIVAAKISF